ncbi:MAG: hypothetical protein BroJett039_03740 [Chloroflexota bacterium]|nr:MAG: hypothetical protein BroJett039_03740 [Chloroflexota bacterium]
MKTGTLLLVGIALAAIAYQIIERVPSDALNVALGVACGVGASIPVMLGLLLALWRERQSVDTDAAIVEPEPARLRAQSLPASMPLPAAQPPPQIIVLAPQGQYAQGQLPQGFPMPAQWLNQTQYPFMHEQPNAVDAREWRIIGDDS